MKEKINQTKSDVTIAWKSFTQFVEATALLILVIASMFLAYKHLKDTWYFYPVVFSAVVVALRAAHEYWKHFTRK